MNDYKKDARERIEAVDEQDYEQYAYMVMKSLRGSWRKPQTRVHILRHLCQHPDLFDEKTRSTILSKTNQFRDNYFDGWHDGRTFRSVYEPMDVGLTPEKARELSEQIPHDMTWDEYRFEKMEAGEGHA